MTSKPQAILRNDDPAACESLGFVVAMRAHIIGHKPEYEWIIVSRWGTHGEYVTIGWTSFPASDSVAPIQLTPYQTALAVREKRSANRTPATFRLAPSLPGQMRVAGTFVPAEGYVRLFGNGSTLGLQSEGQCLGPALRSAWHMGANRAAWIGEFIDVN